MSYQKQDLLTIREHLISSPVFLVLVHVANFFSFLCCPIMCHYVLSSVLWCPMRCPHKMMFGSSLPPVVCKRAFILLVFCVCLRIVFLFNILLFLIFLVFCTVLVFFVFVLCFATLWFVNSCHMI